MENSIAVGIVTKEFHQKKSKAMEMWFYWINDRIKQGQFIVFWSNSLVSMPTAVELSDWMAVGPCFHLISERVVRMGTAVWVLIKMVPYLASAADAIILRMILHTASKMPLVVGTKYSEFSGSGGPSVRKLTPLARLLD